MMKTPWPNGSGVIIPKQVVYTVVITVVGTMLTWTSVALWYGGQLVERVKTIAISVEQVQVNREEIAELRGRVNTITERKR